MLNSLLAILAIGLFGLASTAEENSSPDRLKPEAMCPLDFSGTGSLFSSMTIADLPKGSIFKFSKEKSFIIGYGETCSNWKRSPTYPVELCRVCSAHKAKSETYKLVKSKLYTGSNINVQDQDDLRLHLSENFQLECKRDSGLPKLSGSSSLSDFNASVLIPLIGGVDVPCDFMKVKEVEKQEKVPSKKGKSPTTT